MHNILITQKVFIDKYNQVNWSLENNWFKFFKRKKVNLIPLGSLLNIEKKLLFLKPKGIIFSGGNDLYNIIKLKENLVRDKFELKLLKFSIKNKIPVLAVCRGFQLVAKFFKSQIVKKGNHVRSNHILNVKNRISGFKINKIKVNSYHNYTVNSLPKYFNLIVRCSDNSIEIAKSDKYKILNFMFHPERSNISQEKINKIVFSHFKI
tara:strand:+ start:352 stop:972 length:621 start_codon:yes stop_codon:yes gene_type:complete